MTDCNHDFQISNRARINDNWTFKELFAAYERTYIPGSKTAVFYNPGMYRALILQELHRTKMPKLLWNRLMLEIRALVFPSDHFWFEIFDRKLQQYIEAGLIDFNIREWKEANHLVHEYEEPFAVLTLGELEAGFVVSLLPLVFSVFVFGIEWMQTLKDLLVFLYIFKKYYEVKSFEQFERCKILRIKFVELQKVVLQKQLKKNKQQYKNVAGDVKSLLKQVNRMLIK